MHSPHGLAASALGLAAALCVTANGHAQPAAGVDTIDVIGTTPLGGELDVRTASRRTSRPRPASEIREQGALDLADFMKRNLGSVFVNEAQSNPLQPDVQYRGFVGSPLLGLPQGLAVYQDGVRVNEPFGDTVNWALIPESAIDSVYLVPGSNPLFGLNALGGAIADPHEGRLRSPGTRAEALDGLVRPRRPASRDGRRGRRRRSAISSRRRISTRTAGAISRRPRRKQLFAKLSTLGDGSTLDVSFTHVGHGSRRQRRRARGPARARPRGDLHAARPHARTR